MSEHLAFCIVVNKILVPKFLN